MFPDRASHSGPGASVVHVIRHHTPPSRQDGGVALQFLDRAPGQDGNRMDLGGPSPNFVPVPDPSGLVHGKGCPSWLATERKGVGRQTGMAKNVGRNIRSMVAVFHPKGGRHLFW